MWNYRLLDRSHRNGGDPWVEIIEVFYRDDGSLIGFTEPFINAETREDVVLILKRISEDINGKPVLTLADFGLKPEDDTKEVRHDNHVIGTE
jgi:hypothetical protein